MFLDELAMERSTYRVRMTFRDDRGDVVIPESLVWSLRDGSGAIVNGRARVVVVTPESTEEIVLTGADLQLVGDGNKELRTVVAEATYDSGKKLNAMAHFWVMRVTGLS